MAPHIKTRFLVLSDTHGDDLDVQTHGRYDVAIHCGDLTEESKIDEFRKSIQLLKAIDAPLKLVIAGNHDFTLDTPMFAKKLAGINPSLEDDLVKREYGAIGEARELFNADHVKAAGVLFLDEGTHRIRLANRALLTVFASPYTPSQSDWGFQYHPQQGRDWKLGHDVDIAITHGPPRGILDYTDTRQRAGCPSLFAAIAPARPRMHCFGHIHESWGAKLVTWRDEPSESPSHFTDIDNDKSSVIESLAGIRPKKLDTPDDITEKAAKLEGYKQQGHCSAVQPIQAGVQTLFLNAAIEGPEDGKQQLAWMTEIDLPAATESDESAGD